jgi:hypothetical protein
MKRLAFLSFPIATLIAPIQVQAQQYDPVMNCVRFPEIPNPEAEIRYMESQPNTCVCPGPNDPAAEIRAIEKGLNDGAHITIDRIQHPYR